MNKDLVFKQYKNDIDKIFNKLYREKQSIFDLYKVEYEDLRQDIYLDILKRIDKYDSSKMKITTFLYRLIQNCLCDTLVKLGREKRKTNLLENYHNESDSSEDYFQNYFSIEDDNLNTCELKSLLTKKLTEKEIKIFMLTLQGYSNAEIGRLYNVSGQRIGYIKRNAKDRLLPFLLK